MCWRRLNSAQQIRRLLIIDHGDFPVLDATAPLAITRRDKMRLPIQGPPALRSLGYMHAVVKAHGVLPSSDCPAGSYCCYVEDMQASVCVTCVELTVFGYNCAWPHSAVCGQCLNSTPC